MSIISKAEILQKIEVWLRNESGHIRELDLDPDILTDDTDVGLKSLFDEISILKTEMKQINRLEKKRFYALQDWLNSSTENQNKYTDLIKTQNDSLSKITNEFEKQRIKSVYLSIIELRDFISKFTGSIPDLPFQKTNGWFSSKNDNSKVVMSILENVTFFIKKIDNILEKEDIFHIQTDSKIFDPHKMIAVQTKSDQSKKDNIVIEETERGYMQKNKIIRYAKVMVNQIK